MLQSLRPSRSAGYPVVPLVRRLVWAAAARLVLLTTLLVVILLVNVRGEVTASSFTLQVASATLCCAFMLSAGYLWLMRQGSELRVLVNTQLVLDQVIWTVVVYLSGGVTSGATSLYGISCLFGAVLAGFRGAALAAISAAISYLVLIGALALGVLAAPPDQPSAAYQVSTYELVYGGIVNLLVLVVVALLAGSLTERLRATGGQLLEAQKRADQAEREAALGRLAAGLAHEIRNPLGSISGSIRMLRYNPALDLDDQQLCDIIDSEASRLNDLVADMLNLAKSRPPQLVVVDVCEIAQEVVDLASHTGRGVQDVRIEFSGPEELRITADGAMLRQVLWNLVRNAVQSSTAGETVSVNVDKRGDTAHVRVVDHGAGLSDEGRARLFDAFYTSRSEGTGIGLAVVKRIVDDHGWTIDVEDTAGGGATFVVYFGEAETEREVGSKAPPEPQHWTLFPRSS